MKHPLYNLQRDLDHFLHYLEKGTLFSFDAEEKQTLRTRAKELSQKLSTIESTQLTMGIIGGTGVGKSTLMNALAGSEIASSSHRRPHTDSVLIYRHQQSNPLSPALIKHIPYQEIMHQADEISPVVLCDLPDFDSIVTEHRNHVVDFLENLDILVWVSSPEKYADQRFYEFLQTVPKAEQNFYFVLNKADLLFQQADLRIAYDHLERVAASFRKHIIEKGIHQPLLYTLSAELALRGDLIDTWNHFPAFKREIFQQRDFKQVSAIKAANLDVEIHQLLSSFQKELSNLESFQNILEKSTHELNGQVPDWIESGRKTIELWVETAVKPFFLFQQEDLRLLVGPTYGIAHFVDLWQHRFSPVTNRLPDLSLITLSQDRSTAFKSRLQGIEDRMDKHILYDNLPISFRQQIERMIDVQKSLDDLKERFEQAATLRITERRSPSTVWFRTIQFMAYTGLLIFFLLGIGGGQAWRAAVITPGASSIVDLILSMTQTVFSAKGLAALCSYMALNMVLGFRFYRQYRKRMEQGVEKVLRSLKLELLGIWQDKINRIRGNLENLNVDTQTQISAIHALKDNRKNTV